MLRGNNKFQRPCVAEFKNRCAKCKLLIRPGQPIVKDMSFRKFVHADCARVQQPTAERDARVEAELGIKDGVQPQLPHRLSEASLRDYMAEWDRYKQFASERRGQIPGMAVPWDMSLLWEYLQHRPATCKPTTLKQILTKLSHFGSRHNFVLPSSKFDGAPADHKTIHKMMQQLKIDARAEAAASGVAYAPVDRCTAVGVRSVSMLLSAFQVTDRKRFLQLSRVDRHNLAISTIQHTGGMRFGQFPERDYPLNAFLIDPADTTLRLVTDYSRYAGRRQFSIEFPASPPFASMWYKVRAPNGDLLATYPAATLMHWHFDQLREAGETQIFAPVLGRAPSREARQQWLRSALLDALPIAEVDARALVDEVSPHSFRAGLSGDLYREGVSQQRIMSICRWNSIKVVRIYAERPCLSMARMTTGFRLIVRS